MDLAGNSIKTEKFKCQNLDHRWRQCAKKRAETYMTPATSGRVWRPLQSLSRLVLESCGSLPEGGEGAGSKGCQEGKLRRMDDPKRNTS